MWRVTIGNIAVEACARHNESFILLILARYVHHNLNPLASGELNKATKTGAVLFLPS